MEFECLTAIEEQEHCIKTKSVCKNIKKSLRNLLFRNLNSTSPMDYKGKIKLILHKILQKPQNVWMFVKSMQNLSTLKNLMIICNAKNIACSKITLNS